jgi:hypothetical protein
VLPNRHGNLNLLANHLKSLRNLSRKTGESSKPVRAALNLLLPMINSRNMPEDMTAAEMLSIPGAKSCYWDSIKDVKQYIERMAKDKAKYGYEDIDSTT